MRIFFVKGDLIFSEGILLAIKKLKENENNKMALNIILQLFGSVFGCKVISDQTVGLVCVHPFLWDKKNKPIYSSVPG